MAKVSSGNMPYIEPIQLSKPSSESEKIFDPALKDLPQKADVRTDDKNKKKDLNKTNPLTWSKPHGHS